MSTTPEDFSLIRVLVVDDQSHVRTFARKVLLTMGITNRETIACAGWWQQAGRELGIAINLSAPAFERLDLPERIAALALDARVPPERLTLLQQLPFNELKIDRSFVHGCSASAKQRAVVEASLA